MDVIDSFDSDSEADYTFDAGSSSDVVVTGGQLTVTANPTVEKRMIHTGVGYQYSDVQATIKATPGSTISSFLAGVVLNRIDASNYIRVYVDDNGTNSRLRIDKVVAGVTTNLATTNLAARVANGTPFWVRGRMEGINVFAEHFTSARLAALGLYSAEAAVGFDVAAHAALCRELAATSDLGSRGLPAKAFGFAGVLRERAYHDALRDLATPAMGHPPLIRIAATDGDGAAAYARHRPVLAALAR